LPFKAQPLTLCAYDVDCDDVLDLRDPAILAAHGVDPEALACPWKDLATRGIRPPSWAVADRLVRNGIAGVVVLSFARGATALDVNAVFWRWSDSPPHQVRVVDPLGRLPRDGRSWG
jgi:RES domain-containing protein